MMFLDLGIVGWISGSVSSLLLSQASGVIRWLVFSLTPSSPLASRLETPLGRSFIHMEIFASHEVGRPVFRYKFCGSERGIHLMAPGRNGCGGVAGRRLCRPRSIPLRSPLSFHPLLHFSALAIPRDVGLDFLGNLISESWRFFCLMGLFGTLPKPRQIGFGDAIAGRGLMAGSKDTSTRRKTSQKETLEERGRVFVLDIREGFMAAPHYYSLAVQR